MLVGFWQTRDRGPVFFLLLVFIPIAAVVPNRDVIDKQT